MHSHVIIWSLNIHSIYKGSSVNSTHAIGSLHKKRITWVLPKREQIVITVLFWIMPRIPLHYANMHELQSVDNPII